MIFASVFSIIVGAGMIGQWVMSYANQQIPELRTEPIRIWFHIAAELVTALCLICGGIGLLINVSWARPLYLIAIGMLFYTSIVSPGYFAQKGQWAWLTMFVIIIILGIVSLILIL